MHTRPRDNTFALRPRSSGSLEAQNKNNEAHNENESVTGATVADPKAVAVVMASAQEGTSPGTSGNRVPGALCMFVGDHRHHPQEQDQLQGDQMRQEIWQANHPEQQIYQAREHPQGGRIVNQHSSGKQEEHSSEGEDEDEDMEEGEHSLR